MNASIETNINKVKKNDQVLYTVTVQADTAVTSAVIDILPSAEVYPKMLLTPDTNVTTDISGLTASGEIKDNGIFTVTLSDIPSLTEFSFSYTAYAEQISEKNTTAAMITLNHSGSIQEAYAQTVVLPANSTTYLYAGTALLFIAAVIFFIYRILLHSR